MWQYSHSAAAVVPAEGTELVRGGWSFEAIQKATHLPSRGTLLVVLSSTSRNPEVGRAF